MVPAESTDLAEAAQRRVGETLRGKWRLDALLGVGGMAAVYAATHRNGMRGAVKLLHGEYANDKQLRERFTKEGYFANKLDHIGAVRVLDDDVAEDNCVFIVMELLDGEPLDVRAEHAGGRLEPRDAMLLADQLLDTLAVAHDKGIVHRDIKPENLFLTRDGVLKILDFGIAQLRQGRPRSTKQTLAGQPLGTPAYMAPEQARGRWELVDASSDLWSVGATFFSLLSGRLVHEEETVEETLAATFTKPARSLATVAPDVPPQLVAWVDRALALEKDQRWSSGRAMRAALREAYIALFGEPMPDPPSVTQATRASGQQLRVSTPQGFAPRALAAPTPGPLAADTRPDKSVPRGIIGAVAAVFFLVPLAVILYLTLHTTKPTEVSTPPAAETIPATATATATVIATATATDTATAAPTAASATASAVASTTAKPRAKPAFGPRPKQPATAKSVDMNQRTWSQ